ncbi:hypothetical protein DDB_G0271226 [Dictyostelium discoideum AX4]|uniref:Uncharacterized protein n=1 Tax=Dictyostelium discoideum TaxID=44689 RepID=Q55B92_DICDI|nr:hypothetical protein DDB_G0271226 [Dictyostelium discoideum AX4]EAL71743.1 hypothetical protein DDB_G0271226 [Dictyostelium discoideum AX4]|eukprot:XP_645720.1 hypothetical protein DDB_G0271226 [Dictyostelium discoideum AX4]
MVFKIFKGKKLFYNKTCRYRSTHVNCSSLFGPDISGQQVKSIDL